MVKEKFKRKCQDRILAVGRAFGQVDGEESRFQALVGKVLDMVDTALCPGKRQGDLLQDGCQEQGQFVWQSGEVDRRILLLWSWIFVKTVREKQI